MTPTKNAAAVAPSGEWLRVYLDSLSCYCLPKHEECREIRREFDLTTVQGHPRSSISVSMESPYVTSYYCIYSRISRKIYLKILT